MNVKMSNSSCDKKIAILGATSHIAKGLIYNLLSKDYNEVCLFARRPKEVESFLKENKLECIVRTLEGFDKEKYDIIINCIGIGNPCILKKETGSIFRLTEKYDNLILDCLEKYPETMYINFSSGAVYGKEFSVSADKGSMYSLGINNIQPSDYYAVSKINSEAKHRALKKFNIVDIRIFSYFSRHIDLSAGFLMTEIILAVLEEKEIVISSGDFMRDYIHPKDLFDILELFFKMDNVNGVFDAYSKKPISKFAILEYFSKNFGLKYSVNEELKNLSITGNKNMYYSNYKKILKLGYTPKFSSLDSIIQESKYLINKKAIKNKIV